MSKVVVMFIVFGVSWHISNYFFAIHGVITSSSRHKRFHRLLFHVCVCVFFYFYGIHPLVLHFTERKLEISVTRCNFILYNNVCCTFRSYFVHLKVYSLLLDVVYWCLKLVEIWPKHVCIVECNKIVLSGGNLQSFVYIYIYIYGWECFWAIYFPAV